MQKQVEEQKNALQQAHDAIVTEAIELLVKDFKYQELWTMIQQLQKTPDERVRIEER